MIEDIGRKIKELRTSKNLTLKVLSERTNLSIGFLSQLERGLTPVAIDSLEKISRALGVELTYFFKNPKKRKDIVIRSYEKEVYQIKNNEFIQYHLTNDSEHKKLLPRLIELLPSDRKEEIISYPHKGEEFVYVLEGILTLDIEDEEYQLYPGDSAHYGSTVDHNWVNHTNRTVRLLTVHYPNFLNNENA